MPTRRCDTATSRIQQSCRGDCAHSLSCPGQPPRFSNLRAVTNSMNEELFLYRLFVTFRLSQLLGGNSAGPIRVQNQKETENLFCYNTHRQRWDGAVRLGSRRSTQQRAGSGQSMKACACATRMNAILPDRKSTRLNSSHRT